MFHRVMAKKLLVAVLASLSLTGMAVAQSYPSQPVKLIVPFAVGGGVDILARVLGEKMSKDLGQPVVVENRVGAGGGLGSDYVAKAKPDGYTLLVATTGTHGINPILYPSLPYDAQHDFVPISLIAAVSNVLVVGPRLNVNDLGELIAQAKKSPDKLSYASFGNGTSNHLSGELLNMQANIDAVHVPYKSATQAVTDLMGGQIDYAFVNLPLALPHINAGKLRALAITSQQRNPSLPGTPTMSQAGMRNFVVESWYGLMAPRGTSLSSISVLQKAVKEGLNDAKVRESFIKNGAEIRVSDSQELSEMIAAEQVRWKYVVQRANVKVD